MGMFIIFLKVLSYKLLKDPKFQKFNLCELRTCSSDHKSQTECLLNACSGDIVRNSKGFESWLSVIVPS